MEEKLLAAVDLGGTKIVSAVLDRKLESRGRDKRKTLAEEGGEAVFRRIAARMPAALENAGAGLSDIAGVGVACPGPLDGERGVILETPNLGFRDFPLCERLREELGVPVRLENDLNAGTYG